MAVSNGGGLSVSGSPITSSGTITISHADTSSQATVTNSGRTYIQSVTLDTYGHVTALSSATETVTDTNTTYTLNVSGTGTNANKVGLVAGGSGSGTTWYTIPYATAAGSADVAASATTAGTADVANSVAWANVSGHEAGVKADIGIATSGTTFLRKDGTWATPTDTNTTYALSGALSSHKFTSTLTAGGSGSGTSTTDLTLAAGSNITLTDDTSNRKITIAATDTNTTYTLNVSGTGDNANKIGLVAGGSGSGTAWYTVPYATSAGTAASASSVAWANVSGHDAGVDADLGINTSSGDTTKFLNAKGGWAVPAGTYVHPAYDTATAAAVKIGRDSTGHVTIGAALTAADVGAATSGHTHTYTLNGASTTSLSFYAPTGAGTSGQYLKSNGSGAPSWTNFPTIPSITLNGSSTTSPAFYAPTGAGTSGQYLKSNGSGAPTWATLPTVPTITLNGSATTSPSFYAPVSAGTSGYVLQSNGSGAPSWVTPPSGLPAVTVADNDKVLAVVNGAWAPSTAGSASIIFREWVTS